jgi:chromosome segregation ATPase
VRQLQAQVAEGAVTVQAAAEEARRLRHAVAQARERIAEREEALRQAEAEADAARAEVARLEREVGTRADADASALGQQLAELRSAFEVRSTAAAEAQAEVERLRGLLDRQAGRSDGAQEEVDRLREQVRERTEMARELDRRHREARARVGQLEAALAEASEHADAQPGAPSGQLQRRVEELRNALASERDRVRDVETIAEQALEERTSLEDSVRRLRSQLEAGGALVERPPARAAGTALPDLSTLSPVMRAVILIGLSILFVALLSAIYNAVT